MPPLTADASPVTHVQENKASTAWCQMFPVEMESLADSMKFVQRLIYISTAYILESRRLLPPSSFKKRCVDGALKTYVFNLKSDIGSRAAIKIKGVAEAINIGYLDEFFIVVGTDKSKEHDAKEVWSFKMAYGEDGATAELRHGDSSSLATIRYPGADAIREKTVELLLAIRQLSRNILLQLPEDAFYSFRVTYTDVAPKGYQANGFRRCSNPDVFDLDTRARDLELARFALGHNKVRIACRSVYLEDEWTARQQLNMRDELDLNESGDSLQDESFESSAGAPSAAATTTTGHMTVSAALDVEANRAADSDGDGLSSTSGKAEWASTQAIFTWNHNKKLRVRVTHIRNLGDPSEEARCVDAVVTSARDKNKPVGLYSCHGQGDNQYWMLSKDGEIRRDESCVDYAGQGVMISPVTA